MLHVTEDDSLFVGLPRGVPVDFHWMCACLQNWHDGRIVIGGAGGFGAPALSFQQQCQKHSRTEGYAALQLQPGWPFPSQSGHLCCYRCASSALPMHRAWQAGSGRGTTMCRIDERGCCADITHSISELSPLGITSLVCLVLLQASLKSPLFSLEGGTGSIRNDAMQQVFAHD